MHNIFKTFVDHLSSAQDTEALSASMAEAAAALDLSCFAYLSMANPYQIASSSRSTAASDILS
jgi:hypothetical protein